MPVKSAGTKENRFVIFYLDCVGGRNHEKVFFFAKNVKALVIEVNDIYCLHHQYIYVKSHKYRQNTAVLLQLLGDTNVTRIRVVGKVHPRSLMKSYCSKIAERASQRNMPHSPIRTLPDS